MGYSKKDAVSIVINSAEQYKKELLNRTLLFICTDKHKNVHTFEVTFRERNYMHLTGLVPIDFVDHNGEKHKLSASEFFNKCITKTLSPNQFDFHQDGTTQLKLAVLHKLKVPVYDFLTFLCSNSATHFVTKTIYFALLL